MIRPDRLNKVTAGVPKNGAARFSLWWSDRGSWPPANRYTRPNRQIAQSGFARSRVEVSEQVLSQILLRSSLQQRQSLLASMANGSLACWATGDSKTCAIRSTALRSPGYSSTLVPFNLSRRRLLNALSIQRSIELRYRRWSSISPSIVTVFPDPLQALADTCRGGDLFGSAELIFGLLDCDLGSIGTTFLSVVFVSRHIDHSLRTA